MTELTMVYEPVISKPHIEGVRWGLKEKLVPAGGREDEGPGENAKKFSPDHPKRPRSSRKLVVKVQAST